MSTTTLGSVLSAAALLVAVVWTERKRPWRNQIKPSTVEVAAGGASSQDPALAPVDERPPSLPNEG